MWDRRRLYETVIANQEPSFVTSITPTLGAELLADPGLEGTYTAGKVAALTKDGSPTLAQSADVHGGAKAQEYTGAATSDGLRYIFTAAANTFYRCSVWGKRTAGENSLTRLNTFQSGASVAVRSQMWTDATYVQKIITPLAISAGSFSFYGVFESAGAAHDTIIIDDFSVKAISLPSCFRSFRTADALTTIVKAKVSSISGNMIGVAANVDSSSNPLNFVLALVLVETAVARALLYQCSNGVFTLKQNTVITYAADAQVEIRHTASTTYQIWYNGVQVGTDQTISDAAINTNTLYAQFSVYEGNTFSSFEVVPNP